MHLPSEKEGQSRAASQQTRNPCTDPNGWMGRPVRLQRELGNQGH